jgi:hypothetical protein
MHIEIDNQQDLKFATNHFLECTQKRFNLFYDVKILTEAGSQSLMTRNGRPNANTASDHFPILVNFVEN